MFALFSVKKSAIILTHVLLCFYSYCFKIFFFLVLSNLILMMFDVIFFTFLVLGVH